MSISQIIQLKQILCENKCTILRGKFIHQNINDFVITGHIIYILENVKIIVDIGVYIAIIKVFQKNP